MASRPTVRSSRLVASQADQVLIRRARAKSRATALRTALEAFDADGRPRRGYVGHGDQVLTILLPFRAVSPNRGLWGAHWRTTHGVKATWRARLDQAVAASVPAVRRLVAGSTLFPTPAALLDWAPPTGLAAATLTRHLPSTKHEITDPDNLAFSFKGLIDAIVAAGFLRGDSIRHITRTHEQLVSADGLDWTEIEIDARPRKDA